MAASSDVSTASWEGPVASGSEEAAWVGFACRAASRLRWLMRYGSTAAIAWSRSLPLGSAISGRSTPARGCHCSVALLYDAACTNVNVLAWRHCRVLRDPVTGCLCQWANNAATSEKLWHCMQCNTCIIHDVRNGGFQSMHPEQASLEKACTLKDDPLKGAGPSSADG